MDVDFSGDGFADELAVDYFWAVPPAAREVMMVNGDLVPSLDLAGRRCGALDVGGFSSSLETWMASECHRVLLGRGGASAAF